MRRLGLTPDELLFRTWCGPRPRYAAQLPGLNVLEGETLALVGADVGALHNALVDVLPASLEVDGANAAAAGTLRIHAQQAVRVGVRSLVLTDPFVRLAPAARSLAIADLAGFAALGVTTVFACRDLTLAALAADRVCLVRDGRPGVAYPVVAPRPRSVDDVRPVTERAAARLAQGRLG
jgi:hypothetical protein